MATHRIVADTFAQTYRTASLKSQKSITLPKNELVTVIEENIGKKCDFNKIVTLSGIECFIQKKDIESLPMTPRSAPFVCINSIPNFSYVEPNWYKLSEDQPYYNERTFEYSICITINQNNLNSYLVLILDKYINQV